MEKESHLGKRTLETGAREGGGGERSCACSLWAPQVQLSSASWTEGETERVWASEQKLWGAEGCLWKTPSQNKTKQGRWYLWPLSPSTSATRCSLYGECCIAGHLLLFWENWRAPGRCEFLAQPLSTAAPRYRWRNVAERANKAEEHSSRLLVPKPSICLCIHSSLLPSVHLSLLLCVWEVTLWQVVSQHAVEWPGRTVPTTRYGHQTLLAVLMKGFKLTW